MKKQKGVNAVTDQDIPHGVKYYIYNVPKGSPKNSRIYFKTYNEARAYISAHAPPGPPKGVYHIYPADKSGYTSKSDGRTSFGEGNKPWEKMQGKQRR